MAIGHVGGTICYGSPFLRCDTGAGVLGRLAQLVEHFVYTEGVGGSIPSPPTSSVTVHIAALRKV
jgi:hypothetical protein